VQITERNQQWGAAKKKDTLVSVTFNRFSIQGGGGEMNLGHRPVFAISPKVSKKSKAAVSGRKTEGASKK